MSEKIQKIIDKINRYQKKLMCDEERLEAFEYDELCDAYELGVEDATKQILKMLNEIKEEKS